MATSAAGRIRVRFACSVCGLALTSGIAVAQTENFALPAAAQQTSPQLVEAQNDSSSGDQSGLVKPGNDIEAIEVSASRINIAGYEQPTPVTVVSAQQLDQAANADIGDTLRQLPQFGLGSSPEKGSNGDALPQGAAGMSTVNLRNLGITRNLVLFDGQRVVNSNLTGGVDLSLMPSALISRVDVVTGGASAAWGSDAVSGVVNLVLNKSFTGFKTSLDGTDTGQNNRSTYGATATYGIDLDGDRGHVEISGQYMDSPQAVFVGQEHWWNSTFLLTNPAYTATNGQPQYLHYNNVGEPGMPGGAILTGPLANNYFTGAGVVLPYNPGIVSGSAAVGGTANAYSGSERPLQLAAYPYRLATLFGYGSYKVTPDIVASVQLNYGYNWSISDGGSAFNTSNVISVNNPYLPASIVTQMNADRITSFQLSDTFTDNIDMHDPTMQQMENSVGMPVSTQMRQLYRGVFSLDGSLGSDWSWKAYYEHSESRLHELATHVVITQNLTNAINAVTVTPANVGSSGLATGSIACASTLTNPNNGCAPLNIIGTGNESQAALNYVEDSHDFQEQVENQDVVDASAQGILPLDLTGAGRPSIAFGADYRKEGARVTAAQEGVLQELVIGNFSPMQGHYDVYEGFVEANVPLLKDTFVDSLNFDASGRMTGYSTSGIVETWKQGLVAQVNSDLRLRATWSYDIRAPNLSELYSGGVVTTGSPLDPKSNKTVTGASTDTLSNPNLVPEKATTVSAGAVLTPHWLEGLSLSFDWYSISVKDYVASPSATLEAQLCQAGNQFYCSQFTYNSAGTLAEVYVAPQNAAVLTTSGLDFQANYTMPLFWGNLAWNLVGNYTDEQSLTAFNSPAFDYAGSMSAASQYQGVPKTHFNLSATYIQGPWSATVQTRFIGAATLNNAWTTGIQVDNNYVPPVAYLDLRLSYQWSDGIQLYGAVDNTTDVPPPSVPTTLGTKTSLTTVAAVYDILGRLYHAGIRYTF